jgi:hypothetical protein
MFKFSEFSCENGKFDYLKSKKSSIELEIVFEKESICSELLKINLFIFLFILFRDKINKLVFYNLIVLTS